MSNKINFEEGTAVITAQVNKSPGGTMFDFFKYKSSEGEIALELKNKTDLIFTHFYKGKKNILIFDFTDYFNKRNQITVTWDLKSTEKALKLYINGQPKKTESIK